MSRWGKPRKNVKRIDPRYFMDEKMERLDEEEINIQAREKARQATVREVRKFEEAGKQITLDLRALQNILRDAPEKIGTSYKGQEATQDFILSFLPKITNVFQSAVHKVAGLGASEPKPGEEGGGKKGTHSGEIYEPTKQDWGLQEGFMDTIKGMFGGGAAPAAPEPAAKLDPSEVPWGTAEYQKEFDQLIEELKHYGQASEIYGDYADSSSGRYNRRLANQAREAKKQILQPLLKVLVDMRSFLKKYYYSPAGRQTKQYLHPIVVAQILQFFAENFNRENNPYFGEQMSTARAQISPAAEKAAPAAASAPAAAASPTSARSKFFGKKKGSKIGSSPNPMLQVQIEQYIDADLAWSGKEDKLIRTINRMRGMARSEDPLRQDPENFYRTGADHAAAELESHEEKKPKPAEYGLPAGFDASTSPAAQKYRKAAYRKILDRRRGRR